MKYIKIVLLIALSFVLIFAAPVKNSCILSKNYDIKIQGTSNVHSWTETVETVTGNGTVNMNDNGSFDLEEMHIKMEVNSIKSSFGTIMNNNTYKALKSDVNPQIIFLLTEPVKSIQKEPREKMIPIKGILTIAGVTKVVNMNVKIRIQENSKLSFEGRERISMEDYGIKPPVALFGTLKTGNEIIISFKTNFLLKTINVIQ